VVAEKFPNAASLIELSDCSLIFDGHRVLDEISFTLRSGQRWALVGANGSGKTLLLKMLRGDVWPTPTGRERRHSTLSKQQIAYLGPERQDKYVRYDWNLTVTQVVTTGLFDEDIALTQPTHAQRERVTRVLRRFGLWGLRQRRILTLSYGQRRLALVARLFASNAPLLLLDEVFNGLDARAKEKLRVALERPRSGHDWVLTSHRPKELPNNVTHIARIEHGRIVSAGPIGKADRVVASRVSSAGTKVQRRLTADVHRGRMPDASEASARAPLFVIRNADIYRDYRPVIRKLDWTLRRGDNWAVLGPNGSGKSSLLNVIHGDLHPALGGTIEREGVPRGTHIEFWKKRLGWVSPELQADHYLAKSIEEIVMSGRYASIGLNDAPTPADRAAANRWLKFFNIEHLRARGPRQVSYGQMRIALLARAMINDPELLLLDEPCTGLDGDVRATVLGYIQQLAERGTQIIMAVHDVEDIVPAIRKVLKIVRGGTVQTLDWPA
jgi:molybdate transport system ATP-binding protein